MKIVSRERQKQINAFYEELARKNRRTTKRAPATKAKAEISVAEMRARLTVQRLALEALEAKRERDPLAELERILNEP